jgi:hypothetical protein
VCSCACTRVAAKGPVRSNHTREPAPPRTHPTAISPHQPHPPPAIPPEPPRESTPKPAPQSPPNPCDSPRAHRGAQLDLRKIKNSPRANPCHHSPPKFCCAPLIKNAQHRAHIRRHDMTTQPAPSLARTRPQRSFRLLPIQKKIEKRTQAPSGHIPAHSLGFLAPWLLGSFAFRFLPPAPRNRATTPHAKSTKRSQVPIWHTPVPLELRPQIPYIVLSFTIHQTRPPTAVCLR